MRLAAILVFGVFLPKKSDVKADDKAGDNGLDEWKAARDIFDKFDDRINDIRKFGFTFLSGLITADALTKLFNATDDRVRLGVVGITLLLTVALLVLDKNYQLFQFAAGIRAKVLETRLNLELTETIGFRSDMDKFKNYVLAVYLAFAAVAGASGNPRVLPSSHIAGNNRYPHSHSGGHHLDNQRPQTKHGAAGRLVI